MTTKHEIAPGVHAPKQPIAPGMWKMRGGGKAWVAGKCPFSEKWIGRAGTHPREWPLIGWSDAGRAEAYNNEYDGRYDLIEPWR